MQLKFVHYLQVPKAPNSAFNLDDQDVATHLKYWVADFIKTGWCAKEGSNITFFDAPGELGEREVSLTHNSPTILTDLCYSLYKYAWLIDHLQHYWSSVTLHKYSNF